jgi:hypothetical protein
VQSPRARQSRRLLLKFPDGVVRKGRFQSKAKVANVRAAVARELGAAPGEVVLKYGPNKLSDDRRLIVDLGLGRSEFIAVFRD